MGEQNVKRQPSIKRWLITVCECGELWWAITPKDCCSADKKTIEFIDAADLERRAASTGDQMHKCFDNCPCGQQNEGEVDTKQPAACPSCGSDDPNIVNVGVDQPFLTAKSAYGKPYTCPDSFHGCDFPSERGAGDALNGQARESATPRQSAADSQPVT